MAEASTGLRAGELLTMMYVTFDTGHLNHGEWHVGEATNHIIIRANEVVAVQADGDELEFVLSNFGNLPRTLPVDRRVMRWYGDHAKFIAGNLPYRK